jgi:hypothetical protein
MTLVRNTLLSLALATAACVAQTPREDIVVMKDSTIIRGKFASPITPGGEIYITRQNGKTAALRWFEAALVRRLPVGISDSLLLQISFRSSSGTGPGTEGDRVLGAIYVSPETSRGDSSLMDMVILGDGTILRGTLLETQRGSNPFLLWTLDGRLRRLPAVEVRSALRLPRETTDSTITVLHINPPPELLEDNFRVVTVFAGMAIPSGSFATPKEEGGVPAGVGLAAGVHASVRIFPTWRIAGTVTLERHPSSLPAVATNFTGSGSPPAQTVLWLLAGPELRTEGTAAVKGYMFAQAGMLFLRGGGFDFVVPETRAHTAGTGKQEGVDAHGVAFCFGGGVSYGRFSLTARWSSGTAPLSFTTVLSLEHYLPLTYAYTFDQTVSVVSIVLGFSPF